MCKKEQKTNVMRLLDEAKISYTPYCYVNTGATNGEKIAKILNEPPSRVFKTLVTIAKSGIHYVFVIPVNAELDLKKAAGAAGEKAVSMLKQKDLLPLTGYVHGGCSPIGMKKPFKTFFDETATSFDTIFFSGGKVGFQVQVSLKDIKPLISFNTANLII